MGHPLQIIRVKKVTGNLNFLWLINTPYSKMLATIGPVYREVEDFGRWGNMHRWDNPPVHVISHFNLDQEPISWNEQNFTAFSRTSFFSERFWREFRISFKSHKPVSKTYRPKKDNFCLFMHFLYTSNAFIAWWMFHFLVKNCPKMYLKINRSVKTPWHRPSMGVARSGLWAAVWTRWHDRWGHPLRRAVRSEVLKQW